MALFDLLKPYGSLGLTLLYDDSSRQLVSSLLETERSCNMRPFYLRIIIWGLVSVRLGTTIQSLSVSNRKWKVGENSFHQYNPGELQLELEQFPNVQTTQYSLTSLRKQFILISCQSTVRWPNFDLWDPKIAVFLPSIEATPCGHLLKWKLTPQKPPCGHRVHSRHCQGSPMKNRWRFSKQYKTLTLTLKICIFQKWVQQQLTLVLFESLF